MSSIVERIETGEAPRLTAATPPAEDGVIRLNLDAESWAILADKAWLLEEYNAGRWEPFAGEHIAVVRKQLVGHGRDLIRLREEVARQTGVSPDRIVTAYVEPPIEV